VSRARLAPAVVYSEFEPLLRRIADLAPDTLVRLKHRPQRVTALVRTPFQVTAARSIATSHSAPPDQDVTLTAGDLLAWLDGAELPERRDAQWHWPVPPERGWQHLDDVPDDVLRGLVRSGSQTLAEAAEREGVPGAQPRAETADALLDSVVLTVSTEAGVRAELTLRTVSALVRLGFLPRESPAKVAVSGRWTRVAGSFGSVFAEGAPQGLPMGLSLKPIG
jgi:hypothetical protein